MLGAGIAKYANQIEGGASQLNKVLRDLPTELAEEFSPSLTNPSGKALKDVDMYDFLDYFIRVTKHNNNSVSELAQSLQALREFERGKATLQTTTPDNIDIIADKNLKQGIKMENQMDFLEISTPQKALLN